MALLRTIDDTEACVHNPRSILSLWAIVAFLFHSLYDWFTCKKLLIKVDGGACGEM